MHRIAIKDAPSGKSFSFQLDVVNQTTLRLQLEEAMGSRLSVRFFYNGSEVLQEPEDALPDSYQDGQTIISIARKLPDAVEQEAQAEEGYHRVYRGTDIISCLARDGNLMLDIISDLGSRNPLFLSHVVVAREHAREYIFNTLRNPEFTLTVKGDDVSCDPIRAVQLHPCGDTGYEVDKRNVEYIAGLVGMEPTPELHETYLFFNRDIQRTLSEFESS